MVPSRCTTQRCCHGSPPLACNRHPHCIPAPRATESPKLPIAHLPAAVARACTSRRAGVLTRSPGAAPLSRRAAHRGSVGTQTFPAIRCTVTTIHDISGEARQYDVAITGKSTFTLTSWIRRFLWCAERGASAEPAIARRCAEVRPPAGVAFPNRAIVRVLDISLAAVDSLISVAERVRVARAAPWIGLLVPRTEWMFPRIF